eukprot:gnl/TRDRNA2_/TRDRNA2_156213_c1_seq1.p1 gnl/TRDRNA2_/TRDRNA2_156213_c1~~gnl/TRDRNA2_/TRDRNA2_156213_c1_seq1.p1  ORF type:complete len:445 (-),score=51.29 gnl/TRDRNA2_/TRDRNA2_156213_c1_seq1:217-1551(-)
MTQNTTKRDVRVIEQVLGREEPFFRHYPTGLERGKQLFEYISPKECVDAMTDGKPLGGWMIAERNFSVTQDEGMPEVVVMTHRDAFASWEGIILEVRSKKFIVSSNTLDTVANLMMVELGCAKSETSLEMVIPTNYLFLRTILDGYNSRGGCALGECSLYDEYAYFNRLPRADLALHVFPSLVTMLKVFSINYFHWTAGVLPHLVLFAQSEFATDPVLVYPTQFWQDAVKLLNISRPIYFDPNQVYFANTLRHFKGGTGPQDFPSRFNVLTARSKVLMAAHVPPSLSAGFGQEALLISRRDSETRQILNEEAVTTAMRDTLAPMVIGALTLSTLQWIEQVRRVAAAGVMVGVEGAGLSNLIYMPKAGLVVIVLPGRFLDRQSNYGPNVIACGQTFFWHLAEACGLKSKVLMTAGSWLDNITVSITPFRTILSEWAQVHSLDQLG